MFLWGFLRRRLQQTTLAIRSVSVYQASVMSDSYDRILLVTSLVRPRKRGGSCGGAHSRTRKIAINVAPRESSFISLTRLIFELNRNVGIGVSAPPAPLLMHSALRSRTRFD